MVTFHVPGEELFGIVKEPVIVDGEVTFTSLPIISFGFFIAPLSRKTLAFFVKSVPVIVKRTVSPNLPVVGFIPEMFDFRFDDIIVPELSDCPVVLAFVKPKNNIQIVKIDKILTNF